MRLLLRGSVAAGVVGAGIGGRHWLLPPPRSERLGSVDDLAAELFESLDADQRSAACVGYDHPYRQYHNRGVRCGGLPIGVRAFGWEQRRILTELLYAGLSEAGRERLPEQFFIHWPGIHLLHLLVCGEPGAGPYQIILSGPHLNLRLGGTGREGVAFGGPQVYGDQRGNDRQGLPGNVYRYQFETAQRLFGGLEPGQKGAALLRRAPIQTRIELQGTSGAFPGVRVASLSPENRAIAADLVEGILSTYRPEDVGHARACLDANGGVEEMHLSYYEEGEVGGSGEYQIFRLEGPAAVFYFRGFPHVHAFLNVGMDGDRPLSVGEVLGENPAVLESEGVKRLFEDALRHRTGADLAYYPLDGAVGRLRTGTIRSGDIYNLESWQNFVVVAEIRGADLGGRLLDELRAAGIEVAPGRTYSVATTGYVVREEPRESLGRVADWRRDVLVRDAAIAYLRERGFPAA